MPGIIFRLLVCFKNGIEEIHRSNRKVRSMIYHLYHEEASKSL